MQLKNTELEIGQEYVVHYFNKWGNEAYVTIYIENENQYRDQSCPSQLYSLEAYINSLQESNILSVFSPYTNNDIVQVYNEVRTMEKHYPYYVNDYVQNFKRRLNAIGTCMLSDQRLTEDTLKKLEYLLYTIKMDEVVRHYQVGQTLITQNNEEVTVLGYSPDTTGHRRCFVCSDYRYRYDDNSMDRGRCTGTNSYYINPHNIVKLSVPNRYMLFKEFAQKEGLTQEETNRLLKELGQQCTVGNGRIKYPRLDTECFKYLGINPNA